ncbi:MAG: hypothetical protein NTU98_01650 [Bacteroidetes bacterium]|nr:hypothetical protein [Bacteroidota bacterium]
MNKSKPDISQYVDYTYFICAPVKPLTICKGKVSFLFFIGLGGIIYPGGKANSARRKALSAKRIFPTFAKSSTRGIPLKL